MSDRPHDNPTDRGAVQPRLQPARPPIQWPIREKSNPDNERAANIARQHVQRVYSQEGNPNETPVVPPVNTPVQTTPVAENQHIMRDQPYDWQQYHTAWQQYYHQYFYRYYAGWWQQQKEAEAPAVAQLPQVAPPLEEERLSDKQRVAKELRDKVRGTVEKQAKRAQASSHFKPILAAITVGATFLLINYNQVLVGAVKQYVTPGSVVTTPVIVEPNTQNSVSADPKIIIPKIGVEAPVVYDEARVDNDSYEKALENGVVRLGNTANPGTNGNVVIGGHSSNNVFNPGKYKYVFVNLRRLDVGDIFYLNYGGVRYTYKITVAKKIIKPNETSALNQTATPTVTLFTCDPPGTNVNRLIVQAQQIDPDPAAATVNANQQTATNKANPLPSVAPSIWDRLFKTKSN